MRHRRARAWSASPWRLLLLRPVITSGQTFTPDSTGARVGDGRGGGLPAESRHGPFRMVLMSVGEEMATSFGNVAQSYDKVRPEPPAQALDWLVPPGCDVAVDLAAGTGLFTRALLGRAAQVVAVEPDERMRAVLAQRSPQVRVLRGWGEAMPLPDASADAVFVSTAWHWLDPARAVPEIGRVLRSGGRLGVIWTSR